MLTKWDKIIILYIIQNIDGVGEYVGYVCSSESQCNSFSMYVDCNWITCTHTKCPISIFTYINSIHRSSFYSKQNWFVASKHTIHKQRPVRMQILKDIEIEIEWEWEWKKNDNAFSGLLKIFIATQCFHLRSRRGCLHHRTANSNSSKTNRISLCVVSIVWYKEGFTDIHTHKKGWAKVVAGGWWWTFVDRIEIYDQL